MRFTPLRLNAGGKNAIENASNTAQAMFGNVSGVTARDEVQALLDTGLISASNKSKKKMLVKVYGQKVKSWDKEKTNTVFNNLIKREYQKMSEENEQKKQKKALKNKAVQKAVKKKKKGAK